MGGRPHCRHLPGGCRFVGDTLGGERAGCGETRRTRLVDDSDQRAQRSGERLAIQPIEVHRARQDEGSVGQFAPDRARPTRQGRRPTRRIRPVGQHQHFVVRRHRDFDRWPSCHHQASLVIQGQVGIGLRPCGDSLERGRFGGLAGRHVPDPTPPGRAHPGSLGWPARARRNGGGGASGVHDRGRRGVPPRRSGDPGSGA